MSATTTPWPGDLRFGAAKPSSTKGWTVEWVLKRNCSLAPRQVMGVYASLCAVSLLVATWFWFLGAKLVMPFAWAEILALGLAWGVYARHALDRERIQLVDGRLHVELQRGGDVERVEFRPDTVRVEPARDNRSLIELSGQGKRVTVGRFVRPELRQVLADEFRRSLARARHAPGTGSDRIDATETS